MKLINLIEKIEDATVSGSTEIVISGLTDDSRDVQEGYVFVAIKGENSNGEDHIAKAIELGAKVIITEQTTTNDNTVTWVRVRDTRRALAKLTCAYYEDPSSHLKLIGITGTNGKTTTSYMIHHILMTVQHRAGIVGTIKSFDGENDFVTENTTPGVIQLNQYLKAMVDNDCRSAAIEVSSHGISQHRVSELSFKVLTFTNLTQDHLDYHGTMENYFQAKRQWFVDAALKNSKTKAVINSDDNYGARLVKEFSEKLNVITYGQGVHADYRFTNIKHSVRGSEFELQAKGKSYLVRVPTIGSFNVYNSVAAIVSAIASGISARNAIQCLAEMPQVPGRLELIEQKMGVSVFVDYAHTPDAIMNVGQTLQDLDPKRLITVFGCGGDRDATKRPQMAKAAGTVSDYCIITSDNPRTEDPEKIIAQVEAGMVGCPSTSFVDREEAINNAISVATGGDIVLIAGKGHEDYQIFAEETIPFDDRIKARYALREFKVPSRNIVDEEEDGRKPRREDGDRDRDQERKPRREDSDQERRPRREER